MGGSESKPNPSPPDDSGVVLTKFAVGMTCGGCASAVSRILNKIEGVSEVKTDVEAKEVWVRSKDVDVGDMMEKLKKWGEAAGKDVELPATQ
jgi:copper chaperone CopZ